MDLTEYVADVQLPLVLVAASSHAARRSAENYLLQNVVYLRILENWWCSSPPNADEAQAGCLTAFAG